MSELGWGRFEKVRDVGRKQSIQHSLHIDKGSAVQRSGQFVEGFLGGYLTLNHFTSQINPLCQRDCAVDYPEKLPAQQRD